jgi:tRNA nucleotidyltransferase (CCA-adding enzyme)
LRGAAIKKKKMTDFFFKNIAAAFAAKSITAYFVGGCVRDSLLGVDCDDIDICLVGASGASVVEETLSLFGKSERVGAKFPVWILDGPGGQKIDFALARREKKAGGTRKDFSLAFGPEVSIGDDLSRRDLTVNAVAQRVSDGEIIDPFSGVDDLNKRIARPVSPAFSEDTLRVIRAARFCARFGLAPSAELAAVCRGLRPTDISPERVGAELDKTLKLKQCPTPSVFFRLLKDWGWLGYHFPEVEALIGVQQDPGHHPEGDAFEHTMHCLDAAQTPLIRAAMLCHDLGKASTTVFENGKWRAPGHDKAGVAPALAMLERVKLWDKKRHEQIALLVEAHMFHILPEFSRKSVARMSKRLGSAGLSFADLAEVCRCDLAGRPPLPAPDAVDIGQHWLEDIEAKGTARIVTGKMLIAEGFKPGKEMGAMLDRLEGLQMEGVLDEGNWRDFIKKKRGKDLDF